MKRLKVFDNFNRDEYWDDYLDKLNANLKKSQEESQINWDDHFRLIDQEEAHEWMIKMSDVTKEDFRLVVSSLDAIKYEVDISTWKLLDDDGKYENHKYILAKRRGFSYKIFRLPDEWFLVIMSGDVNIFYLCDQLEGLKVFLNKGKV
jgi:hypothetical protein